MQATLSLAELSRKRILVDAMKPELRRKFDESAMQALSKVADVASQPTAGSSSSSSNGCDQAGSSSDAAEACFNAAKAINEPLMNQLRSLTGSMCDELALSNREQLLQALHVSGCMSRATLTCRVDRDYLRVG
jgi:hypothetical protein